MKVVGETQKPDRTGSFSTAIRVFIGRKDVGWETILQTNKQTASLLLVLSLTSHLHPHGGLPLQTSAKDALRSPLASKSLSSVRIA